MARIKDPRHAPVAEILTLLRQANPKERFTVNDREDTIGVWEDALQAFRPCLSKLIMEGWAMAPRVLVNGQPLRYAWKEEAHD